MNEEIKAKILEKIKENDKIVITRHLRPDGDAVGSTTGLKRILELTYPEKDIRLINSDYSGYINFLGEEDEEMSEEEYKDFLVIVLDTGVADRISNPNFNKGKAVVKIDHHIEEAPYGDVVWVEELRSSACEMVADFYKTFQDELKMDKVAATCLYTGMVTDSGRFRYRDVSPETLRLAAELLEYGIDTDTLYAHLYLEDYSRLKFQAWVYKKMKKTENGVLYVTVSRSAQKRLKITSEQASSCISMFEGIKGCLMWLAFIEGEDGRTRVRLRSRFVECQPLATRYHGGGHACASGAKVNSRKEKKSLVKEADEIVKAYKETHEGWL